MDLAAIETTARKMAAAVAQGYGRLEDPRVPDFAGLARRAEAWLVDVADTARAGRARELKTKIIEGEAVHCERCHDASPY